MASGIKLTYEYVSNYFKENGCELLEKEYKNARTKMRYKCICGNTSEIVFYSFKLGNRCRECGNKKNSEKQSLSQIEAYNKFQDVGCVLIGEYKSSSESVKFKCHCGRVSDGIPNNIWKRKRCGKCGVEARSGHNHYMWYDDRDKFYELCSFKDRCHKLITMSFRVSGRVKNKKTAELLGYDYKKLQDHITSFPEWNEIRKGKWHVDHIFPIKSFIEHGISDLKLINSLDNLRPLPFRENCRKSSKYCKIDFYKWLEEKGVKINASPNNGF